LLLALRLQQVSDNYHSVRYISFPYTADIAHNVLPQVLAEPLLLELGADIR
jgi:hypothetical protein